MQGRSRFISRIVNFLEGFWADTHMTLTGNDHWENSVVIIALLTVIFTDLATLVVYVVQRI